jgi:hypothetical protein
MAALIRQQKITFGEMRESGVCGILVYCSDYRCSHSTAINADHWPDDERLSDIETRLTCQGCANVALTYARILDGNLPCSGRYKRLRNAHQRPMPLASQGRVLRRRRPVHRSPRHGRRLPIASRQSVRRRDPVQQPQRACHGVFTTAGRLIFSLNNVILDCEKSNRQNRWRETSGRRPARNWHGSGPHNPAFRRILGQC